MAEFIRGARVRSPEKMSAKALSVGEVLFVLIEVAKSHGVKDVDELVRLTRRAWEAHRIASESETSANET